MPGTKLEQAAAAFREGRLAEAQAGCEEVLRLQPKSIRALRMLGVIAARQRQPRRAAEFAARAVALNPALAAAHFELGLALSSLNRRKAAVRSYERAFELRPDFFEARVRHGIDLAHLGRHDEALASAEQALALRPASAEALNLRGAALMRLGRPREALDSCEQALRINSGLAGAISNCGQALQLLGRYAEALECCDRALAIWPDLADAHLNKSVVLLRLGDLQRGFEAYEWRWKTRGAGIGRHRHGDLALWSGEPLHGKRILLHAEQGLGDSIQFLRYAPMVRALGAETILEVPPALQSLAQDSLGNEIRVVTPGHGITGIELQCPLMSLPRAFKTALDSIPAPVSYLRADRAAANAWAGRLGSGRRIGLAWAGRKEHHDDRNRSIALRTLVPLLALGVQFVSLQKPVSQEDGALLRDYANVLEAGAGLRDYADTAALVDCLDLVITVDSSVAHLAGALGKEVWILLPFVPDWRWLLGRSDSPWYPAARLFRQPTAGDWDSVITELRSSLAARRASGERRTG